MLAALLDDHPDRYLRAADAIDHVVRTDLSAFAPKERWAMDWYYPVMTGTMEGSQAKDRLASLWDTFVMDGLGVRCVSDEPWVTAAETAECALAHAALGDTSTARTLLSWTRPHRNDDGSYTTGLVHPEGIPFPENERTAYTAAAIILAVDSTVGASPGSRLFKHGGLDR
jgi:hypothetical protein